MKLGNQGLQRPGAEKIRQLTLDVGVGELLRTIVRHQAQNQLVYP